MKRALALYLPYLSIERRGGLPIDNCQLPIHEEAPHVNRQLAIGNRQFPAVTVAPCGQTLRIVHLNAAAEAIHLRPGQTLAEARAIAPNLASYEADPSGDRREMESLAVWGQCLSPTIHIEGSDTLIVDVTGCERLWKARGIGTPARPGQTPGRRDEGETALLGLTVGWHGQAQRRHAFSGQTQATRDHVIHESLSVDAMNWEGETNLLKHAVKGIHHRGFTVRAAIADTAGAAWALAHAHGEPAVISAPGMAAADLAPLPVWSLRVERQTVEALRLVGVQTVGALLHLPRSSLASRFGEAVLERIDQALGDLPEVLTPYVPTPSVSARLEWGTPIGQWELLQEALRRTVHQFCEELARKVVGVRRAMATFYCPGIPTATGTITQPVTMEVSLSRPTRSAKHLLTLLGVQMEQLRLPGGAEAVMVWAAYTEPFDDPQCELFETATLDRRALGDLLDRLAVRLGAAAVVRPEAVSDHQPEYAFRYQPLVQTERQRAADFSPRGGGDAVKSSYVRHPRRLKPAARPEQESFPVRPLRLSRRPVQVVAMSVVPDGPPIAFRYRGRQHAVAQSIGPERIETGWWRGPQVRRDYYRVATEDGLRCWLFRDRVHGHWFIHGWFD